MSAHKVANKRRAIKLTIVFFAALLCLAFWFDQSLAQSRKKSTPAKSKTVGDILKKIERKAEKVNFEKRKSALPKLQQQPKAAPPSVNLRSVKPPSSTKLYYQEGSIEAQLEKATDGAINDLYKLTTRYAKSSKRGELWLRLAELYVEKARLIEYRLLQEHDSKMADLASGKTKRRPKLDLRAAQVWNKKAVQLYEWFIRDFPKDPKVDQALFFLGYNFFELGDTKKGEQYYAKLTKEFPKSSYVVESNFALGEYYFENEKWKDALKHYIKVAAKKSNRLYSFALYKLAWCNYKLNDSRKGMSYLEAVVLEGRRAKRDEDKGGVSRIRLATEAIKDLIVFFAESGDPKQARNYFERVIGPKSTPANLSKLAYFYSDIGNKSAAKYLFKSLIDEDPNTVRAYDYQYAIVKMYVSAGTPEVFKQELYDWVENYGPGSSWQKINSSDKESVSKANEIMEGLLRNHVLQQHQTAQNARTKTAQNLARSGYNMYFQTFSNGPKIDEMHFFYAELLFDLGDYENAAVHYNWILQNSKASTYTDKALLNSLLAYEKRLPSEAKIKAVVGERTEPIAFDERIKDFESAAYRYFEKAPTSENIVAVKYRLGALYYLFNQFDSAIKIFYEVINRYPKTQYAKASANHLLDIYNLKQDYVGLQKAADDILAIPELAKTDVGNQIKDIKVRTDFKLAKDFEVNKDFLGAAAAYKNFALKNRTNSLALASLFNAGVNFERGGDNSSAIEMYAAVAANKGKNGSEFKEKAKKFLPILYEKSGQYEKAAALFESHAKANPKDKLAEEYHYNAAVIYDGLNYYTKAIQNYQKYFDLYRGRDRNEVLFLIAKIYERQGKLDPAISTFDKYMNSGTSNAIGVVESAFTIAKLHERLRRKKVADEWYKKTIAIQRRLSKGGKAVGISYAAEAKFREVKETYNKLIAIKIPSNPKTQGKVVQQKLGILNSLKEELKAVIAYDDAFQIVAALTLQGLASGHMYSALISAPAPKGFNPEELKQYKSEVQKIADPFLAQAKEAYQTAIDRGFELQGYNDALKTARLNLAVLNGKKDMDPKAVLTALPDWIED